MTWRLSRVFLDANPSPPKLDTMLQNADFMRSGETLHCKGCRESHERQASPSCKVTLPAIGLQVSQFDIAKCERQRVDQELHI